jgi:hypothetical protein
MARGKLFDYAVLYHPKPLKDNAQNDVTPPSTIIVNPARGLFVDEKEAGMRVSRMIPTEYDDKIAECEILVRPF